MSKQWSSVVRKKAARMVIDSETHVIERLMPIETNPEMSPTRRFTWHPHSGDLLVAEMDRAGVDKVIMISYDADDVHHWLRSVGKRAEDFRGGKKYTLLYVRKYPDRLLWFTTLADPLRHPDYLDIMRSDLDEGALGIKVFPAHCLIAADDPRLMAAYRVCAERGGKIMIALEDRDPPRTPLLREYHEQLDRVFSTFPDAHFQINHGGNVDPNSAEAEYFYSTVRAHGNVWVSTGPVEENGPDDTGLDWRDGHEYPFRHYLSCIEKLLRGFGPDRLEWATDWPWMEHFFSYPQAVDSILKHADFMTELEKANFMGLNAARFLGL